ncbi:RidA family protein [Synergistaceae bacterium OttesenSCG-928-D05]|nr:RidA family protein [Synergistaceae bacterium OttesenSCG-928-D05]
MQFIRIDGAIKPSGHYSPATQVGNLLFISGQLPTDPFTGEKITGDIEAQTKQVLKNVKTILKSAGAKKQDVAKVTIYLADMQYWDKVNEIYAEFFDEHRPARCVIPTKELHGGYLIEIEAIAQIREQQ